MEGLINFEHGSTIISLILEENDLDKYITQEVPELEGDEAKVPPKRSMDKAKRIISYSITDRLIPHVSSFIKLKYVYDALRNMFKGKNISCKMTLRN